MEPVLSISNLTTGYGRIAITSDATATLAPGTLTCLLGSNGAGKSTMLRTLCGFQRPVSGSVMIDDIPIKDIPTRQLATMIGVVLTERPTALNMTVENLVALGRTPYTSLLGTLRDDDRRAIDEAIKLTGIDHLRNRRITTLSDGERQRALISKALAQNTPIILLDEPTSFLDYPGAVDILQLLRRLAHERGITVLLSTHHIDIALHVADTLWLLQEGRLVTGAPAELAESGAIARSFETPSLRFNPSTLTFSILN